MFKQFTILPSYFGKFFLFSDSILVKYYKAFERAILSVMQLKRITERRVPELIPILGSQPAGDVSHNPGGRLPLLSPRPAVTAATLKRAATNFAAW